MISAKIPKYIHIDLCVRFTKIVYRIARVKATRIFLNAGIVEEILEYQCFETLFSFIVLAWKYLQNTVLTKKKKEVEKYV